MLKHIGIRNYRSCIKTSLELHPNLSVLIGPNGSGKTNILQAIMLLSRLAREGQQGDTAPLKSLSSVIDAHFFEDRTEAILRASIGVHPDETNKDVLSGARVKWNLKSRNGRKFATDIPLGLEASGYGYYRYLRRKPRKLSADLELPPAWAATLLERVARFCTGIRYYGASQFTNPSGCPTSFTIEAGSRRQTVGGFSGHKAILRKIYLASKYSRDTDYAQFMDIVGRNGLALIDDLNFEEVEVSSTDYTVKVGGRLTERKRQRVLVIPQFRIGRQVLSPNQLSEGTFKTLSLLFHVITDTSSLLLIEEPEVCVHHGLLSSILELIKSASNRKQIIISTHSDYVLDHVKPENVFRITRNALKGTVANKLEDALSAREFAALRNYLSTSGNLGEYWREGGLGDRP